MYYGFSLKTPHAAGMGFVKQPYIFSAKVITEEVPREKNLKIEDSNVRGGMKRRGIKTSGHLKRLML